MSVAVTEEIFDAVAAPLGAALGLCFLEQQLDALSEISEDIGRALAEWEPGIRERAASDLLRCIRDIRDVLDRLEAPIQSATQ